MRTCRGERGRPGEGLSHQVRKVALGLSTRRKREPFGDSVCLRTGLDAGWRMALKRVKEKVGHPVRRCLLGETPDQAGVREEGVKKCRGQELLWDFMSRVGEARA